MRLLSVVVSPEPHSARRAPLQRRVLSGVQILPTAPGGRRAPPTHRPPAPQLPVNGNLSLLGAGRADDPSRVVIPNGLCRARTSAAQPDRDERPRWALGSTSTPKRD